MTTDRLFKKRILGYLIALVVFVAAGALCVFYTIKSKPVPPEPTAFDAINASEEQGYLDVKLLIGPFAERSPDDDSREQAESLFAVMDTVNCMYIVIINDAQMEPLREIYDYTYDETMVQPPSVRVFGYSEEITGEMIPYILDGMNTVYDIADYSEADLWNEFGYYALNCTVTVKSPDPQMAWLTATAVCGILILMNGLFIIFSAGSGRRAKKTIDPTIDLGEVDAELADPITRFYQKANVYITPGYYVSGGSVKTCIRFADVRAVHGADANRVYYLSVQLKNSVIFQVIATLNNSRLADALYEDVAQKVRAASPNADIHNWPVQADMPIGRSKYYRVGF